jgi:hypothetical protein
LAEASSQLRIIKQGRNGYGPASLGLLDIFAVGWLPAVLWVALVLDIVIIDIDSLANLGIKSLGIGQTRKG